MARFVHAGGARVVDARTGVAACVSEASESLVELSGGRPEYGARVCPESLSLLAAAVVEDGQSWVEAPYGVALDKRTGELILGAVRTEARSDDARCGGVRWESVAIAAAPPGARAVRAFVLDGPAAAVVFEGGHEAKGDEVGETDADASVSLLVIARGARGRWQSFVVQLGRGARVLCAGGGCTGAPPVALVATRSRSAGATPGALAVPIAAVVLNKGVDDACWRRAALAVGGDGLAAAATAEGAVACVLPPRAGAGPGADTMEVVIADGEGNAVTRYGAGRELARARPGSVPRPASLAAALLGGRARVVAAAHDDMHSTATLYCAEALVPLMALGERVAALLPGDFRAPAGDGTQQLLVLRGAKGEARSQDEALPAVTLVDLTGARGPQPGGASVGVGGTGVSAAAARAAAGEALFSAALEERREELTRELWEGEKQAAAKKAMLADAASLLASMCDGERSGKHVGADAEKGGSPQSGEASKDSASGDDVARQQLTEEHRVRADVIATRGADGRIVVRARVVAAARALRDVRLLMLAPASDLDGEEIDLVSASGNVVHDLAPHAKAELHAVIDDWRAEVAAERAAGDELGEGAYRYEVYICAADSAPQGACADPIAAIGWRGAAERARARWGAAAYSPGAARVLQHVGDIDAAAISRKRCRSPGSLDRVPNGAAQQQQLAATTDADKEQRQPATSQGEDGRSVRSAILSLRAAAMSAADEAAADEEAVATAATLDAPATVDPSALRALRARTDLGVIAAMAAVSAAGVGGR